MSLVMQRKSCRKYTEEPVSDEDIKKLLTSAMQAPSAHNQQPWEFVVVRDRETLDKLSKVSTGAWMLAQAPLCISVVMRDTEFDVDMRQQDMGASVQNILLEAVNLGLGACWIGAYPIEERMIQLNEILNLKDLTPFANISIGHPTKTEEVKVRFDESRIHYEKVK
ncbi:FMN reductase [Candidatus Izimaplasma bacterium HR1]|uniref:nitroreductase family protein n=1 Tax=Candidatus Izimoplasma sp. HR1 TaxID=1541959 RepID=UPI0004F85B89|nr:FMN reductase [Candidatus Izimaplasma bacterium HR1]